MKEKFKAIIKTQTFKACVITFSLGCFALIVLLVLNKVNFKTMGIISAGCFAFFCIMIICDAIRPRTAENGRIEDLEKENKELRKKNDEPDVGNNKVD